MSNDAILKHAIEVAKKQILDKLADDEPYLFSEPHGLYHQIKKMPNGKKTFTIHVEDGFVTDLLVHTSIRTSFRKKKP